MGNQPVSTDNYLEENYLEMEKEQRQLLGQVRIMKNKHNLQLYSIKEYRFGNDDQFHHNYKRMCRRRTVSEKKHSGCVIKLTGIHTGSKDEICGKTYLMYCLFEHIDINLKEYMYERKHTHKPMKQEELIHFLKAISQGVLFMHDNNLKNYFLSKLSIVVHDGTYKILDTLIVKQPPPYLQIYSGIPLHKGVYLAPEQLNDLKTKNNDPDYNIKSDIFTAGMLALELATFDELDCFYDYDKLSIDMVGIQNRIQNIPYSKYIKDILREMTEVDEEERIGFLSLKQKLFPNDTKSTTDHSHLRKSNFSSKTLKTYKTFHPELQKNHSMLLGERKRINSYENYHYAPSVSLQVTNPQPPPQPSQAPSLRPSYPERQIVKEEPQTPINWLNSMNVSHEQTNIESTPIRKVQALQSHRDEKDLEVREPLSQLMEGKKYGKHYFSNGAIYEGEFDCQHNFSGTGILYYPNGSICYSGNWENNSFNGFGILFNEEPTPIHSTNYHDFTTNDRNSWIKYEGQFRMDHKHGFGTLYFTNGDKFSGCFTDDTINGYGTFTPANGTIYAGIWKNNVIK